MNKRLVILVSASDFSTDPRVYKQAIVAKEDGFCVTVCCYGMFEKYTKTVEEGCNIIRIPFAHFIHNLPGFPRSVLVNIFARVILRHEKDQLGFDIPEKRPFNKLFTVSEMCRTYLWAIVFYLFIQIYFYFVIKNEKADIYHATDLITLLTGSLLKLTNRGKLVYDSHEMWIESMEEYTPAMKKMVSIYERILIRYADAITTVNKPIAEELSIKYNILEPTVVMNTPLLQPEPTQKHHDDVRVIYQGRYTKNRGIESAIVGVSKVSDVSLYMRGIDAYGLNGEEPFVDELKQINAKTKFIPPVEMRELVQSLNEFDIGIVPYVGNNFNNLNASPNKIFEYMMAGLAVISSDIPVMKDIVETCDIGMVYKQDDPEDLARVLREMLPNLDRYKKNARMWAEKEYNWNVQGKKLIDIYNELV